jgi:hypothetical protein
MELNAGVARTPMETGYSRQRRIFTNMVARVRMQVVMEWRELHAWQAWWKANAYTWFTMPAVSGFVPPPGSGNCARHVLRCTSNLSIQVANVADWCTVQFDVEFSPGTLEGVPEDVTWVPTL